MLIKRVSVDRKTALHAGQLIALVGLCSYALAAIGILGIIITPADSRTGMGIFLFFGIAGFVLRKLAKKIKTDAENVKYYLSVIINGNTRQLDNIAATTGKPFEIVKSDIQKMIKKGYLKNAYIDESRREIVLPGNAPVPANPTNQAKDVPMKIVACSCCGANNTITGAIGECEYCGSPIQ